jgi:hypothetical protein
MSEYDTLPDPPDRVGAATVLARLLDGLGFRYNCATDGLTEADLAYRASAGGMSIHELLSHIRWVLLFAAGGLGMSLHDHDSGDTYAEVREATLALIAAMSERLKTTADVNLAQFTLRPHKDKDEEFSFWYAVNGPIADALTHVGQVTILRRAAGNPVAQHSVFRGTKG